MTQLPSVGTSGKLAMDSSVTTVSDFDSGSIAYEFNSESLRMRQTHVDSGGIRGTRSVVKDRVRIAQEDISGSIVMNPTPIELDTLLPRIMGAAESTDSFAFAETLPVFGVLVDRVTKVFTYTGCYVNRATFSGSQGQLIRLSLDILGKTEVVSAAGTYPGTVPAIDTAQGYVFADTTFSLSGDTSAAEVSSWEIVIDNVLDGSHYVNSVTRTQIVPTDRIVTVRMSLPYDADSIDLYDQAVAGAAGTLTLTNGGCSTLFTFANLKAPAETPVISGRGSILMLDLSMRAYMSSSTRELVITHDSAP